MSKALIRVAVYLLCLFSFSSCNSQPSVIQQSGMKDFSSLTGYAKRGCEEVYFEISWSRGADGALKQGPLLLIPRAQFREIAPTAGIQGEDIIIIVEGGKRVETKFAAGEIFLADLKNLKVRKLKQRWPTSICENGEELPEMRIGRFLSRLPSDNE